MTAIVTWVDFLSLLDQEIKAMANERKHNKCSLSSSLIGYDLIHFSDKKKKSPTLYCVN